MTDYHPPRPAKIENTDLLIIGGGAAGIAAAVGPDDSPHLHAIDTIEGGQTNSRDLVETMAEEGPEVIYWLENIGLSFDRENDGNFRLMKILIMTLKKSNTEVYPNRNLSGF